MTQQPSIEFITALAVLLFGLLVLALLWFWLKP